VFVEDEAECAVEDVDRVVAFVGAQMAGTTPRSRAQVSPRSSSSWSASNTIVGCADIDR
jgi:hypothetical protein